MDATILRNRFHEEQDYLQKYVEFLQDKMAVSKTEIGEISNILSRHDILKLEPSKTWTSWEVPYELSELENIYGQLNGAKENIKNSIAEVEKELNATKVPEGLNSVDMRSYEGELIQFMLHGLEGDQTPENIDTVREDALFQSKKLAEMEDLEIPDESIIDFAIQSAIYILKYRKLSELEFVSEKFDDIEIALRMQRPEAEINVLRQGFILLMTIFDATVFDIMRVAIQKDFFKLIGVVGKKDKFPLECLDKYNTFDEFRDAIIEEQLKPKYVKDILSILENQNVQYVDSSSDFGEIHLKEMIKRRNIHIHNRGRIDEKYLKRDNNGTPRNNIYNLAIGSVAQIDLPYWEMANRLCKDCVDYMANWVDTL
ncbi:MAG: hypothetical protein ACTSQ8_20375 [Candidatus Helarchaeota archaeon]